MKRKTVGAQLRAVKAWRAPDEHTGIETFQGIPNTYEHVLAQPKAPAEVYRIDCYMPFKAPTSIHRNVYYVPAAKLNSMFEDWGDYWQVVTDIRPMTLAEALAELAAFRERNEDRTDPRPVTRG